MCEMSKTRVERRILPTVAYFRRPLSAFATSPPLWDNIVSSCRICSSLIGPLRPYMTKGFVPITFPSFPHLPHSFTLDS